MLSGSRENIEAARKRGHKLQETRTFCCGHLARIPLPKKQRFWGGLGLVTLKESKQRGVVEGFLDVSFGKAGCPALPGFITGK